MEVQPATFLPKWEAAEAAEAAEATVEPEPQPEPAAVGEGAAVAAAEAAAEAEDEVVSAWEKKMLGGHRMSEVQLRLLYPIRT